LIWRWVCDRSGRCKNSVDVFGGDNAPEEIIKGCVEALPETKAKLLLFGGEDEIQKHLTGKAYDANRIKIINAPDVISIHDQPVNAIRRNPNSSLVMALNAVRDKEAQIFVSAGSTGAVLAGATLVVRRIEGIKRPALAPVLPTETGHVLLIDCGANADSKPEFLQQFGIMGSVYMKAMFGIESPRVG
jgi:glycerol-3-phosphate acyltransferase PlsX